MAFIFHPILINVLKIFVIKRSHQICNFLVIEDALPPKLILLPLSIISYRIVRIIKYSFTMHFVLIPLSNILTSLTIVEHSFAVTHIVLFSALVTTSYVCFGHILKLFLGFLIINLLFLISNLIIYGMSIQGECVWAIWAVGIIDNGIDVGIRNIVAFWLLFYLFYLPNLYSFFGLLFSGFYNFILFKTHLIVLHDVLVSFLYGLHLFNIASILLSPALSSGMF
jgi:hypothetical protein